MKTKPGYPKPHPYKERLKQKGITLWMLRDMTGISEPQMSRYLNNIDSMPFIVQRKIFQFLETLNGNFISVDKKQISTTRESLIVKSNEMIEEENKK